MVLLDKPSQFLVGGGDEKPNEANSQTFTYESCHASDASKHFGILLVEQLTTFYFILNIFLKTKNSFWLKNSYPFIENLRKVLPRSSHKQF